jgi:hypothetical protein
MRFHYDRDRERGRDCVAQNVGRRTSLEVVRAMLSSDRRLASVLSQDCREAGRRRVSRCLGTPHEAVNGKLLEEADRGGMLLLGAGMALIYSGLDQGNPLDWLESGTVVALLGGGGVLTASFFVNEALVRTPWAHAKILPSRNIGVSQVSVAGLPGTQITHDWSLNDFEPMVLLQSFGQAFTLFPAIVIAISNSDPARATAFSAYVQVTRLGGAEIGVALMGTWLRVREQIEPK